MNEAHPGVSGIVVGLHQVRNSDPISPVVEKQRSFDENLKLMVSLPLEAARACFSEHK